MEYGYLLFGRLHHVMAYVKHFKSWNTKIQCILIHGGLTYTFQEDPDHAQMRTQTNTNTDEAKAEREGPANVKHEMSEMNKWEWNEIMTDSYLFNNNPVHAVLHNKTRRAFFGSRSFGRWVCVCRTLHSYMLSVLCLKSADIFWFHIYLGCIHFSETVRLNFVSSEVDTHAAQRYIRLE